MRPVELLGRMSVVGAVPPGGPLCVDDLLRWSRRERTLPVVSRNLGVPCPEERDILARQVVAAHQLREVRREVDALPLKGADVAHRLYPSPSLRDMGDLDLLVRPRDRRAADAALRRLGYEPDREPEERAGATLHSAMYGREGGLPVHLHWRVVNASLPQFMIRIDEEEIWREASEGRVSADHLVVLLCEHALKHSFSELILLTDIELASRGADWERVGETARRWGLERAVAISLHLLRDLMGVTRPVGRSFSGRPLGWAGEALLRLARFRRWNGLSALGYLAMARGGELRWVREALAPSREGSEGYATRTWPGRIRRAAGMAWAGLTSSPRGGR